jgi:YfiH family protein
LNFSVTRGDAPERVAENRRRLTTALDIDESALVRCAQVHGANVHRVDAQDAGKLCPAGDGLVTNTPGLPLALVFADCVPVLLHDPVRRALGVCHAGWRGTVSGAALATLTAMQDAFGTSPTDVWAGIGPSIGPQSYEVGDEVLAAASAQLAYADQCFTRYDRQDRGIHFDLWTANRLQLEGAGVPQAQIEVAGIDTAQTTQDFYSHRGEQGRCGLFSMVAWLE